MPDDAPMQTRVFTNTNPRIFTYTTTTTAAESLLVANQTFDWLFTGFHEIKVTL